MLTMLVVFEAVVKLNFKVVAHVVHENRFFDGGGHS